MSNINQYPLEAFQINDEDFYDVDYWNGVAYETRKISGATLKSILSGGAEFLNDLNDVDTQLPVSPTNADDGRVLYFDIDTGTWISDDIANIANVVKDCKTSVGTGTIPKGTPVYLAGFDNDLLVVEAADASDPNKMPAIGVTAETLDDTNAKKVVSFGKLQGVNTAAFLDGDELYVAAGGGFTTTRPTGSAEIQRVAVVLKSDNPGGLLKVFNTSRTAGLPNLQEGNIWIGDANGHPQEEPLCPLILVDILDTDIIAICRWNGSSFDRFGITGDKLNRNIYNEDGQISAFRTVDVNGQSIVFNDSSAPDGPLVQITQFLTKIAWRLSAAAGDENNVYCSATLICISTANAAVPIELVSDIIKLSNKTSGVSAIMDTSVMAADRTFTWPDQSGTIALLSDITNIYDSNGTITANRTAELNGFDLLFEDSTQNKRISIEEALILIEAGDELGTGIKPIFLKSDNVSLVRKDNIRIELGTSALTTNRTQSFQDKNGTIALLSDITSGAEKHIDTFYAYDMSQASNYSWNGVTVNTTTLGTLNESIRVQVFAGVGGSDGVFVNSSMPLYYTPGDDIKITLNSTHLSTGGDYVLFCGIQEPRPGGLVGDDTSTLWSATGPIAATITEEKHATTITFAGASLTNLGPGDQIAVKIFRDPGDPLDTFTGDVYLSTIGIEIA